MSFFASNHPPSGFRVGQRAWSVGCLLLLLVAGCTSDKGKNTEAARRAADPRALRLLAEAQRAHAAGRFDAALARIDSAAGYAPALADVPYLRGHVLVEKADYAAGRAAFEAALALDPAYPGAWFQLGHLATREKRHREALEAYRREEALLGAGDAAAHDPRALPAVRLQIGRTYLSLGDVAAARKAYGQVLDADSTFAPAHADLSRLWEREGDAAAALAHARRAHALAPDDPDTRYTLGRLLLQAGQAEEALPHLQDAVARRPGHPGAAYNLGRALTWLGRPDEARVYLARADSLQARQVEREAMTPGGRAGQ